MDFGITCRITSTLEYRFSTRAQIVLTDQSAHHKDPETDKEDGNQNDNSPLRDIFVVPKVTPVSTAAEWKKCQSSRTGTCLKCSRLTKDHSTNTTRRK